MPYIGNNHIAGDHTNNFKVLDDISSYTATFDGSATSVVDTTNNTIRVVEHRFIQGQRVTYTNGSGGNIGGLTTGTAYFVIFDSASTFKLATSASNAANSTAINLSAVGTGSSHTLNAAFDGVNTKFKITYNSGTGARFNNATQLNIAINNVLQKPNVNSSTFTEGFAIEDNHKIVFKIAPTSEDIFWGSIIANTLTTFDISDHKIDTFTGDGSTTEFTLSHTPANNESLMVTINGVLQHPSNASTARAYTLIASIIQFTAAPGVGDEIQVRHIGFAGATTADVSGFYGRTGNVVLTDQDDITVNKINVGTGVTIESNGQATFVGVVTFGSGSTTIDNNVVNVGTALTLGHTQGLQFHTQNLHSAGFEVNQINSSGIITASSLDVSGNAFIGGVLTYEDVTSIDSVGIITARNGIDCNGDLDVDGHTNLDNVSISGLTTSVGNITISNTHPRLIFNDTTNNPDYLIDVNAGHFLIYDSTNSANRFLINADGHIDLLGDVDITNDLDVDGHTNLDNVSVAGVTTFASGNVRLASDSQRLQLGSAQDLWMYHTGTSGGGHGLIQNEYGYMYMLSDGWEYRHYGTNQTTLKINANNAVTLYYQNSGKLSTTSIGAQIDTTLRLYGAAGSGGGRLRLAEGAAYSEIRGVRNTDTSSELWFGTEIGDTVDYRAKINTGGHFIPGTDSTYDLGLTGTRWRNVYADTLYGDGSNLTGITQINNNADNRIITGSGTANTLNGETELTYTGGILKVAATYPAFYLDDTDNTNNRFRIIHNNQLTQIDADPNNVYANSFVVLNVDGDEKIRITSDGYIGINESNPYAGLTVGALGDYPTSDGNTYYVPVGKWSTAWNSTNAIVDNTDYWVGYVGGYLKNGCSVNIALAPNRGNTGNQGGMYISGEATAVASSDFTIGKIIGGSATGRGTSGNVRATKSELFRIKNDGRVMIGTTSPSSNGAAYMLTVADPTNSLGNCGITIRAGTGGGSNTNQGSIFYSNATSGTGEYAGYLQYNHNDNWFRIGVNSDEKLRISSNGQLDVRANNTGNPVGITIKNINTNNYSHARLRLESQNAARYADIFADVPNDALRLAYNSSNSIYFKSDGRLGINANPSVANEYLHIKPVGNNVLDIRYELNSSTDIRHNFHDDTGTKRGVFAYTRYANSTDYPNFHHSFYMLTDPASNGTLSTVMRIKQTGEFILPKQPCFSVAMSSNYSSGTSHTANFNVERFDQGDNFNTGSNGIFTAPVTGKYYMHAAIQTQAGGTASQVHIMGVAFTVNGSIQESKGSGDQYWGRNDSYYMSVHCIRILDLAAGDTVQVYILLHGTVAIEGQGGIDRSNWQGYLMA